MIRAENHAGWRSGDVIDLDNAAEVRRWARRLFVTPSELREMVEAVPHGPARHPTTPPRAGRGPALRQEAAAHS